MSKRVYLVDDYDTAVVTILPNTTFRELVSMAVQGLGSVRSSSRIHFVQSDGDDFSYTNNTYIHNHLEDYDKLFVEAVQNEHGNHGRRHHHRQPQQQQQPFVTTHQDTLGHHHHQNRFTPTPDWTENHSWTNNHNNNHNNGGTLTQRGLATTAAAAAAAAGNGSALIGSSIAVDNNMDLFEVASAISGYDSVVEPTRTTTTTRALDPFMAGAHEEQEDDEDMDPFALANDLSRMESPETHDQYPPSQTRGGAGDTVFDYTSVPSNRVATGTTTPAYNDYFAHRRQQQHVTAAPTPPAVFSPNDHDDEMSVGNSSFVVSHGASRGNHGMSAARRRMDTNLTYTGGVHQGYADMNIDDDGSSRGMDTPSASRELRTGVTQPRADPFDVTFLDQEIATGSDPTYRRPRGRVESRAYQRPSQERMARYNNEELGNHGTTSNDDPFDVSFIMGPSDDSTSASLRITPQHAREFGNHGAMFDSHDVASVGQGDGRIVQNRLDGGDGIIPNNDPFDISFLGPFDDATAASTVLESHASATSTSITNAPLVKKVDSSDWGSISQSSRAHAMNSVSTPPAIIDEQKDHNDAPGPGNRYPDLSIGGVGESAGHGQRHPLAESRRVRGDRHEVPTPREAYLSQPPPPPPPPGVGNNDNVAGSTGQQQSGPFTAYSPSERRRAPPPPPIANQGLLPAPAPSDSRFNNLPSRQTHSWQQHSSVERAHVSHQPHDMQDELRAPPHSEEIGNPPPPFSFGGAAGSPGTARDTKRRAIDHPSGRGGEMGASLDNTRNIASVSSLRQGAPIQPSNQNETAPSSSSSAKVSTKPAPSDQDYLVPPSPVNRLRQQNGSSIEEKEMGRARRNAEPVLPERQDAKRRAVHKLSDRSRNTEASVDNGRGGTSLSSLRSPPIGHQPAQEAPIELGKQHETAPPPSSSVLGPTKLAPSQPSDLDSLSPPSPVRQPRRKKSKDREMDNPSGNGGKTGASVDYRRINGDASSQRSQPNGHQAPKAAPIQKGNQIEMAPAPSDQDYLVPPSPINRRRQQNGSSIEEKEMGRARRNAEPVLPERQDAKRRAVHKPSDSRRNMEASVNNGRGGASFSSLRSPPFGHQPVQEAPIELGKQHEMAPPPSSSVLGPTKFAPSQPSDLDSLSPPSPVRQPRRKESKDREMDNPSGNGGKTEASVDYRRINGDAFSPPSQANGHQAPEAAPIQKGNQIEMAPLSFSSATNDQDHYWPPSPVHRRGQQNGKSVEEKEMGRARRKAEPVLPERQDAKRGAVHKPSDRRRNTEASVDNGRRGARFSSLRSPPFGHQPAQEAPIELRKQHEMAPPPSSSVVGPTKLAPSQPSDLDSLSPPAQLPDLDYYWPPSRVNEPTQRDSQIGMVQQSSFGPTRQQPREDDLFPVAPPPVMDLESSSDEESSKRKQPEKAESTSHSGGGQQSFHEMTNDSKSGATEIMKRQPKQKETRERHTGTPPAGTKQGTVNVYMRGAAKDPHGGGSKSSGTKPRKENGTTGAAEKAESPSHAGGKQSFGNRQEVTGNMKRPEQKKTRAHHKGTPSAGTKQGTVNVHTRGAANDPRGGGSKGYGTRPRKGNGTSGATEKAKSPSHLGGGQQSLGNRQDYTRGAANNSHGGRGEGSGTTQWTANGSKGGAMDPSLGAGGSGSGYQASFSPHLLQFGPQADASEQQALQAPHRFSNGGSNAPSQAPRHGVQDVPPAATMNEETSKTKQKSLRPAQVYDSEQTNRCLPPCDACIIL